MVAESVSGGILVTGFMPFAHHERNISQQMIEYISSDEFFDYEIMTSVLTVDERGSRETSERIYGGEEISAVLHLGFSENADEILLERFARNQLEMKIADNSGRQVSSGMISSDKLVLETNAPTHIIDEQLEGISGIRWSEDAGGFVCNETYFRTLLATSSENSPIVLFVHLPRESIIPFSKQLRIVRIICDALESTTKI